jgi:toxin FitB
VEPVTLDTDVASLIIKRKLPADTARLLAGRPLLIRFVTLGELTRWVEQRQWGPHRREPCRTLDTHRFTVDGTLPI